MNELDFLPRGAKWGADVRPVVRGVLTGVNAPARIAQVSFHGNDPVWMPYLWEGGWSVRIGEDVWCARDTITGQAVLVIGPAGLYDQHLMPSAHPGALTGTVSSTNPLRVAANIAGAVTSDVYYCGVLGGYTPVVGDVVMLHWDASRVWVVGKLTSPSAPTVAVPTGLAVTRLDTGEVVECVASWTAVTNANRYAVMISIDGQNSWTTAYTSTNRLSLPLEQGQTVHVKVAAESWLTQSAFTAAVAYTWEPPVDTPDVEVTRTAFIRPVRTSTWFPGPGFWGGWAPDGGGTDFSTLWVGSAFGQGPLEGIALYGDRITQLGADAITAMSVVLRAADTRYPTVDVQAATESSVTSGAPHPVGDVVAGTPALHAVNVPLTPAMCEAFRTGQVGSLRVVSDTFGSVRGTTAADGMGLHVTYKKTI